jgi:hypothetical protein
LRAAIAFICCACLLQGHTGLSRAQHINQRQSRVISFGSKVSGVNKTKRSNTPGGITRSRVGFVVEVDRVPDEFQVRKLAFPKLVTENYNLVLPG